MSVVLPRRWPRPKRRWPPPAPRGYVVEGERRTKLFGEILCPDHVVIDLTASVPRLAGLSASPLPRRCQWVGIDVSISSRPTPKRFASTTSSSIS